MIVELAPPRPLRILSVHTHYQQPGGEDVVADEEAKLLEANGHEVRRYWRHNAELRNRNPLDAAVTAVWSGRSAADVEHLVREFRPDVVHVHNTFPVTSPSIYRTARSQGAAVVQTLHNYRLMCLNAVLSRNGRICTDCVGRAPIPGVLRRCYRDSYAQSLVAASVLLTHRMIGTFSRDIDRYIALTDYARSLFVGAGLPAEKLRVKPNFRGAAISRRDGRSRQGVLFVGRLSLEKGVQVLAQAAQRLPDVQFTLAGDGPERDSLASIGNIKLLGRLDHAKVIDAMHRSRYLIVPSICPEGFPMTIVEAFSAGLPVIASDIGALAEIVTDGVTGFRFATGDPERLALCVQLAMQTDTWPTLSEQARRTYAEQFTPEAAYRSLLEIYQGAIEHRRGRDLNDPS